MRVCVLLLSLIEKNLINYLGQLNLVNSKQVVIIYFEKADVFNSNLEKDRYLKFDYLIIKYFFFINLVANKLI